MALNIRKGSSFDIINMTAMVDVVFQLLVFFLVATEMAREERELAVQLPVATEAGPLTARAKETEVTIDRQGQYSVEARPMDRKALSAYLGRVAANNPGRKTVRIRADKLAPVESVVFIVDRCHQFDIREYPITTAEIVK